MNIVLLGHDDYASLWSLNHLLNAAPQHHYSVFVSGALKAGSDTPQSLAELAAHDRSLVDTFLEQSDIAESLLQRSELPAPNSDEGLATLTGCEPDLIVSIRYRRILKDDAIATSRLGVLNLHSGILPDYRGVMATFWAMLAGEDEIGTTLHRITDAGIDAGPVIEINRQPSRLDASYMDNLLSLYGPGCNAMLYAIETLNDGYEPGVLKRNHGDGAYYSTPEQQDLDAFLARGLKLF